MYLFTRAGRLAPGAIREGMSFVTAITERVHQDTALDVHTWGASMSPELGTVVWATFVERLEDLEAAEDKLAVSEQYLDLAIQGSTLFAGPLRDGLATIVSGQIDQSGPLPSYVTVARATAANGKLSEAMAAGVEIAETATRITGVPTSFMVDATGAYGGCRWNTGHPDIASVERAEAALMADQSWLALLDRVGTAYQAGASQSMYRRII
jgi:hypothetical protein